MTAPRLEKLRHFIQEVDALHRQFSDESPLLEAVAQRLEGGDGEFSLDGKSEQALLMVSLYVAETNQADADLDELAEKLAPLAGDDLDGLLLEGLASAGWQYGIDERGTGLASLTLNFNATWSKP